MNTFSNNYRTFTVGFEDAVKQLEQIASRASQPSIGYPPYNIIKLEENKYLIELAVAGFTKQDIEVELKDNSLVITGKTTTDSSDSPHFLYKGIANRAFSRTFNIADTIEVKNVKLLNGMLKVFLENVIPEHKKPKKLDIEE